MTQCSICLSGFRDPVCIPCGHVYCKKCLSDHANAPANSGLSAKCPDCRASFDLVAPDLTYLPEKYHKFVTNNVRRIYVDFSSSNKQLREALKAAEQRLVGKTAMEQLLLKRCEQLTDVLNVHRQGERDANMRIMELEDDLANLEKLAKVKDDELKELKRMHGLISDKVKCVEKSNQVLQKENVRLCLSYHDIGTKLKEKELESNEDASSNHVSCLSSSQSNTHSSLPPKRKQRKYVVRLPAAQSNARCTIEVSTSEDTPLAMSSVPSASISASRPADPSRPIKPLPKRRSIKHRLIGDSSYMSIDISDFV